MSWLSCYSEDAIKVYDRILKNDIKKYKMYEINSSGYEVDSLEASLWIILNTDTFAQAIIGAINLGSDTDITGAVTGAIVGIIYEKDNIPKMVR